MENLPDAGVTFTLTGEEAHHMLGVVRLRTGEELELIDGSGRIGVARLVRARRGEATLQLLSLEVRDLEPRRKLTIATALPRANRMDFLIEKCCELGLAHLIPLVAERSVVDPTERSESHMQRWRRHVIEACKQCGRTRLTEINPPVTFDSLLQSFTAPAAGAPSFPEICRIMASPEPDAVPLAEFMASLHPNQEITALVGPEGGFSPREVAAARTAGCRMISLGRSVLRVETAVVALTACLLME